MKRTLRFLFLLSFLVLFVVGPAAHEVSSAQRSGEENSLPWTEDCKKLGFFKQRVEFYCFLGRDPQTCRYYSDVVSNLDDKCE